MESEESIFMEMYKNNEKSVKTDGEQSKKLKMKSRSRPKFSPQPSFVGFRNADFVYRKCSGSTSNADYDGIAILDDIVVKK